MHYHQELGAWANTHRIKLPTIPDDCEQPYHLYYLIMPSLDARQRLIAHLRKRGIYSVFHYVPLHNSPMGHHFGGNTGDCPVTEHVSDRLVRLPLFKDLTLEEVDEVVTAVRMFHP